MCTQAFYVDTIRLVCIQGYMYPHLRHTVVCRNNSYWQKFWSLVNFALQIWESLKDKYEFSETCCQVKSLPASQIITLMINYRRFRWYATLENKTPAKMFPKFPSVLRAIDRSDWNPPITATNLTFWPSLHHASGLWLVDFDQICR